MKCDCVDASICTWFMWGEACTELVKRRRDCTVIEVGRASSNSLHEAQRHLRRHGIHMHTISIDKLKWDIEVDECIQSDIRDVKLGPIADLILCMSLMRYFNNDETAFRNAILSMAELLKKDGVWFNSIDQKRTLKQKLTRRPSETEIRVMNKDEMLLHAEQCFHKLSNDCKHGYVPESRCNTRKYHSA